MPDRPAAPRYAATVARAGVASVRRAADDDAERAADAAASSLLARSSRAPLPERACACGGGCPRCRRAPLPTWAAPAEPVLAGAFAAGGAPLDADHRDLMQAHFGADFGAVRIHSDERARAAAASLGADAFAFGEHIAIGAPGRRRDRALLAHELAHVVQQRRGGQARLQLKPAKGGSPKPAPAAVDPAFWEWWKLVAGFEGSLEAWRAQPANAADRGGETNWGVTKKFYLEKAKALGLDPTEAGFAALTPDGAMRFGRMMWKASGASRIRNTGVAIVLADWYWGGIALGRLTALLKAKGFDATYDLGSPSKATTDFMNTLPPEELVRLMSDAKAAQYNATATKDPTQQPFLAGWLARSEARRAQAQRFAAAKPPASDGEAQLSLWERSQRALRLAARAETAADRDAARSALVEAIGAIDRRELDDFAHAEESFVLRSLRDEMRSALAALGG